MGVLNVPKALYKAQQAKKRMSKIEAAGKDESVVIVMNGLSEITEVDFEMEEFKSLFADKGLSDSQIEEISKKLSKNFKKAFEDAKKQIEKELMSSTSLDDLKGLLG